MEIWINPACSKCRTALSILDEEGASYTVRRYLEDPPNAAEIAAVLDRLGLEPWDITRTAEQDARDLGLKDFAATLRARIVVAARTWLLTIGWRRAGLIDPHDTPGPLAPSVRA